MSCYSINTSWKPGYVRYLLGFRDATLSRTQPLLSRCSLLGRRQFPGQGRGLWEIWKGFLIAKPVIRRMAPLNIAKEGAKRQLWLLGVHFLRIPFWAMKLRSQVCLDRSGLQKFKNMMGHKCLEQVRGYIEVLLRGHVHAGRWLDWRTFKVHSTLEIQGISGSKNRCMSQDQSFSYCLFLTVFLTTLLWMSPGNAGLGLKSCRLCWVSLFLTIT